MHLINIGENIKENTSRKEVKFALWDSDPGKIRRILEGNCKRISYNKNKISIVRSLYFDDWCLSSCKANLDGIGRRMKLRLRWYDQLYPPNNFFFEIKWRKNSITGKQRKRIYTENPIEKMTFHKLIKNLKTILPADCEDVLWKYSEPVVMVEYKREHFISHNGKIRITLDHNLVFYNQAMKKKPVFSFGHSLKNLIVVEGKFNIGSENKLKNILFPLSIRPTRCSKYVFGCSSLDLINHSVI